MAPHAVETHGLTRRFGTRTAVDDVSMTVPARSVYGFLGRNGAGKTTTLRLLLGLLHPHAGTVRIDGIDPATDRLGAARRVGALLEAHGFYAHLSGRENLELARRLLGLPSTAVDRVLEAVDLAAHAPRRVSDYSMGMR
ncbi:MAG: ATP-binding cassette domain-containing protein, partial [Pseudomonadota bacterium]|nr:ATP-binding cassette domain-containing protein [Pseudomonadota bacterium]